MDRLSFSAQEKSGVNILGILNKWTFWNYEMAFVYQKSKNIRKRKMTCHNLKGYPYSIVSNSQNPCTSAKKSKQMVNRWIGIGIARVQDSTAK